MRRDRLPRDETAFVELATGIDFRARNNRVAPWDRERVGLRPLSKFGLMAKCNIGKATKDDFRRTGGSTTVGLIGGGLLAVLPDRPF